MFLSFSFMPYVLSYQTIDALIKVNMGLHKNAAVLAWGANTTTTSSSHVVGFQQLLILAASVVAVIIFRRRYLSPISHIPGPFVGSISRWWHLRHIFAGNQQEAIAEAHEQYGGQIPFTTVGF